MSVLPTHGVEGVLTFQALAALLVEAVNASRVKTPSFLWACNVDIRGARIVAWR